METYFERAENDHTANIADIILPQRQTPGSAGYDIVCPEKVVVPPRSKVIVLMGIRVKMPKDKILEVHPRSSFGSIYGLSMHIGIVDSDYYKNPENDGEIGAIICNSTDKDFIIEPGDRVAQGIFKKYYKTDNDTPKNAVRVGGVGSTGKATSTNSEEGSTIVNMDETDDVKDIVRNHKEYDIQGFEARADELRKELKDDDGFIAFKVRKQRGEQVQVDYTVVQAGSDNMRGTTIARVPLGTSWAMASNIILAAVKGNIKNTRFVGKGDERKIVLSGLKPTKTTEITKG